MPLAITALLLAIMQTVPAVERVAGGSKLVKLSTQDAAAFVEEDALEIHLELFGTG